MPFLCQRGCHLQGRKKKSQRPSLLPLKTEHTKGPGLVRNKILSSPPQEAQPTQECAKNVPWHVSSAHRGCCFSEVTPNATQSPSGRPVLPACQVRERGPILWTQAAVAGAWEEDRAWGWFLRAQPSHMLPTSPWKESEGTLAQTVPVGQVLGAQRGTE